MNIRMFSKVLVFVLALFITHAFPGRGQNRAIQYTPYAAGSGTGAAVIYNPGVDATIDSTWTSLLSIGTIGGVRVHDAIRFGPPTGGALLANGPNAQAPLYGTPYKDANDITGPVAAGIPIFASAQNGQCLSNNGRTLNWAQTLSLANGGTGGTTLATAQAGLGFGSAINTTDSTNPANVLIGLPLQFAVGTSQKWTFTAVLRTGSSAGGGVKVAVAIPASATMHVFCNGNTSGITASTSDIITASSTGGATYNAYTGQTGILYMDGSVTTAGTGGNVILQFQSPSGTATIGADSFISWTRVQ